ncbi:MAG: hypothetical protein COB41_06115 [Proteobacteria bacterium]|nr:MAG: hypothetical protein COB41_06115 [Pseudomonadota bacterium]
MNELRTILLPVRHGLAMGVLALIFGALWAAYFATHHEALHGGFEAAESKIKQVQMQAEMKEMQAGMSMSGMNMGNAAHGHAAGVAHNHAEAAPSEHGHNDGHAHKHAAGGQHSHSGSLATDSMQRLLRGHIHFMGIGILIIVVLILVAASRLKDCWKGVFGWTFGLGALMYPPAWIVMGFRTVELGPQGAEASIMWLFGPAVALLIGSLIALFCVMLIEFIGLHKSSLFAWAFRQE